MSLANRSTVVFGGLCLAIVVVAVGALTVGATHIPLSELINSFRGGDHFIHQVVVDIRLPRIIAAVIAGAALGASGPLLQTMYVNPIVDAGLVPIGAGAALGAAVGSAVAPGQPVIACVGAVAFSALAAFLLTRTRATGTSFTLIGVAAGAVATAALGILVSIPLFSRGRSVASWLFGSLALADWHSVVIVTVTASIGALVLLGQSHRLDAASLGSMSATLLGVSLRDARARWSLAAALLVSAAVAYFGIIAFVGLAVPHVLRSFGIHLHRALLPCSAAAGGLLLLLADTAARTLMSAQEVPVGFFVTLVGAPILVKVLMRVAAND
ncbi:MAG: iron ABC transporter permease [Actinobacteria bacterium]|nr:iron ABC transporter permease [Actinomycetota bacterium]